MSNSDTDNVTRPARCPFCNGTVLDTLARVITVNSMWRCRHCEKTWTIKSLRPYSPGR